MSESFPLPIEPEGVIPSLLKRFNSGKIEAMMALYAPEALFVANDGRTITDRAEFTASYISGYHINASGLKIAKDGMSEGSGRRHGQSSQHHRHQRTERLLDYGGWSLSLPDLRKCLDTRGLRHAAGRVAP
jgi:hypothetical protein